MTGRTSLRAPALVVGGIALVALTVVLLTLAPMIGQPRRVVVVLVVGMVLDIGLYVLLRLEPNLSPKLREVVGLLVLGVLVVAVYGLVVWATTATTLRQGLSGFVLVFSPWVLVIVAGVISLTDRRRRRRRSLAIDPVRMIVIASVMTAAWFTGGHYELWMTFRREPGIVAASVVILATAVVLVAASRLRPSWMVGQAASAAPQPASLHDEAVQAPPAGTTEAFATGPTWLEYGVMVVAMVVVLFFALAFMGGGHISKILSQP